MKISLAASPATVNILLQVERKVLYLGDTPTLDQLD